MLLGRCAQLLEKREHCVQYGDATVSENALEQLRIGLAEAVGATRTPVGIVRAGLHWMHTSIEAT